MKISIKITGLFLFTLFLFTLFLFTESRGQALSGIPGLVTTPTADFMKDGTFYIGSSFLPRQTLAYSNYTRDGLVMYASLTFLPYVEVDFRFTKQLGLPAEQGHTADRSPSIRFKLLSERRIAPAVVLGIHDVFSTVEGGQARHFGATYVVLTKRFFSRAFMLAPSLGYGFDLLQGHQTELSGLFGGVKIRSIYIRHVALLIDYDSQYVNAGVDIYIIKMLRIKLGLTNFQHFSANASMHFNLFDVF